MVKITREMAQTVLRFLEFDPATELDRAVAEKLTLVTLATLRAALSGSPPAGA